MAPLCDRVSGFGHKFVKSLIAGSCSLRTGELSMTGFCAELRSAKPFDFAQGRLARRPSPHEHGFGWGLE
jgi:hypothetical protein